MENMRQPRSTVSFHLSSSEKERLVGDAQDSFGSITDYIKFKLFYNNDQKELRQAQQKVERLTQLIEENEKEGILDTPSFSSLFEKAKGQELFFKNNKGQKQKVKIESKEDLFHLMVKCFELWS